VQRQPLRSRPTGPVRVLSAASFGFHTPSSLALAAGSLFATNEGGNSVTEIDTSTGAPSSLLLTTAGLLVTNHPADSVTEVDPATGSLVKVLAGPAYRFQGPWASAASGTNVYVANASGQSPTEFAI
jgi:hypothetical protein